jgi:N-acetyl-anhydromuramyl-L-alanine amidase AmpD
MKSPDGLPYRFVHATHDYGPRAVLVQGIVVHMAEGCNQARYLSSGNVLRGVSATFVVEADGEVVQMLRLDHVSGSLNPREVRTDTDEGGFWGRRWTRHYDQDILSGRANHRTISIEVAGRARKRWGCDGERYAPGPNSAQVAALIELIERLRERYRRRLGVNGHRDFASYKACPGQGEGIHDLLAAVGHGPEREPDSDPEPDDECRPLRRRIRVLRERVEELEDAIGDQVLAMGDAVAALRPYLPEPNER